MTPLSSTFYHQQESPQWHSWLSLCFPQWELKTSGSSGGTEGVVTGHACHTQVRRKQCSMVTTTSNYSVQATPTLEQRCPQRCLPASWHRIKAWTSRAGRRGSARWGLGLTWLGSGHLLLPLCTPLTTNLRGLWLDVRAVDALPLQRDGNGFDKDILHPLHSSMWQPPCICPNLRLKLDPLASHFVFQEDLGHRLQRQ